MVNLVWGKWALNPAGQTNFKTRGSLKEYHNSLLMGRVKRVALISDKIMQVELNNNQSIDGENRDTNYNQSG